MEAGKSAGQVVALPVHMASAGITTDFEKLLTKFKNTESVRYEQFVQIWHEMSMPLLNAGRQNDRECREFTEECLRVASAYCLPPYEFQVRVCGLYLVYALYFRHPFEPRVKIRVTLSEWKELLSFIQEVHQQQHLDVEYVFTHLRHDRAFHFVASKVEMNPGGRGAGEAMASEVQQQKVEMIIEQTSAISKIFQPDMIDELSTIHEEYHRHKCGLAGLKSTQPDPSFNIINPDLVQDITKAVTVHENWRKNKGVKKTSGRRRRDSGPTTSESEGESEPDQQPGPSAPSTVKSVGAIRREIKARAFSTTPALIASKRHRRVQVTSQVEEGIQSSSPRKKGRKRLGSGAQGNTVSDATSSQTADADAASTETSAFGAFLPGRASGSGLLNMPTFEGDDTPTKKTQTKTRKNKDTSAKKRTPSKKTPSKSKDGKSSELKKRGRKRKATMTEGEPTTQRKKKKVPTATLR